MSDSGLILMCRVETPGLPEIKENEWKLPVHCMFNQLIDIIF